MTITPGPDYTLLGEHTGPHKWQGVLKNASF